MCVSLGHFVDVCTLSSGHTCRPLDFAAYSPETYLCACLCSQTDGGLHSVLVGMSMDTLLHTFGCRSVSPLIFALQHSSSSSTAAISLCKGPQLSGCRPPTSPSSLKPSPRWGDTSCWNRKPWTELAHHPLTLPRSLQPHLPLTLACARLCPHSPQTLFGERSRRGSLWKRQMMGPTTFS